MKGPPTREPRRLADAPDGSEAAKLLRALPPPAPPGDAQARVWRKVAAGVGEPRRRAWALAPALVAAAALVVFAVSALRSPALPPGPAAPLLALASGLVEQPSPSRVRSGPGSRALVRVGAAAVLLGEGAEVEVAGAGVAVLRGRVAVSAALDFPVVLSAGEQSVSGAGTFAAELMDSGTLERREATLDERALLERFGRGAGVESRLRVEAPEGYRIGVDGAEVGRSPLVALVPLGERALVARRPGGAELTGEATVVGGEETRYVLREPTPAPAPTSPVPAMAPAAPDPSRGEAAPGKRRTRAGGREAVAARDPGVEVVAPPALGMEPEVEPSPGGLVSPQGSSAPQASGPAGVPDADAEAYAKAKDLLARGEPAQAAALLGQVARGTSSRAEISLYELGRTQLRALKDPAAARGAFSTYLRRYPSGLLVQEVALSLIESELAASDLPAAQASMDRFLAQHPGSERRSEVLLLRANLDRDRGDCPSALERYRALARGSGPVAEDALYFAAACAQQLGRTEEARQLLQDSVQRFPAGRHADEARRALSGQGR